MNNSNPFARSKKMMAAISALISSGINGFDLQQGIAAIGEYKSRGKGGKHRKMCRTNWFLGNPSRYVPHQGKQECARRMNRS